MKILSNSPVFVDGKKIKSADFAYSNGDGELGKKIGAGLGVATVAAGLLSQLPKRQAIAGAESCGKKPLLPGAKRKAWQACVDKANAAPAPASEAPAPQGAAPKQEGMSKGLKIGLIAGGAVVLLLVTVLIIKSQKSAQNG